jgi:hypothetical protein
VLVMHATARRKPYTTESLMQFSIKGSSNRWIEKKNERC